MEQENSSTNRNPCNILVSTCAARNTVHEVQCTSYSGRCTKPAVHFCTTFCHLYYQLLTSYCMTPSNSLILWVTVQRSSRSTIITYRKIIWTWKMIFSYSGNAKQTAVTGLPDEKHTSLSPQDFRLEAEVSHDMPTYLQTDLLFQLASYEQTFTAF